MREIDTSEGLDHRCTVCKAWLYHTGGGFDTICGAICHQCANVTQKVRVGHGDLTAFLQTGSWPPLQKHFTRSSTAKLGLVQRQPSGPKSAPALTLIRTAAGYVPKE